MSSPRKTKTVSYTEAQSKSWLSWLARGMQAHGQTVFMIEQLQPSWLPTRRQRTVYTFTSRLITGIVYGLFFGIGSACLYSGTYVEMIAFVFHGLVCGFIFGMTIACLDLYRFNRLGRKHDQREVRTGWQHVARVLIVGVVFGLTTVLIFMLLFLIVLLIIVLFIGLTYLSNHFGIDPPDPESWFWIVAIGLISAVIVIGLTSLALNAGAPFVHFVLNFLRGSIQQEQRNPSAGWRNLASILFVGAVIFCNLVSSILAVLSASVVTSDFGFTTVCVLAVVFSIICGIRQRKVEYDIQTVETLNWSWVRGRKGVLVGAPSLASGVLCAIWLAVTNPADSQLIVGFLLFALFCGFIPGLFVATVGGLQQGVAEMKTSPNKGIVLSMRSAAFMSVVCGLIVAVILSLIPLAARAVSDVTFGSVFFLKVALILGTISALLAGSWFGGLDVLNHYLLRTLLYLFGHTPRNYINFLDYAAKELNFLQKVGGGYIFIHRILLEHFAAMENEGILKPQEAPIPSESASGK